jgi:hypothetical protein
MTFNSPPGPEGRGALQISGRVRLQERGGEKDNLGGRRVDDTTAARVNDW